MSDSPALSALLPDDLQSLYASAAALLPADAACVLLHIDEEQTLVVIGHGMRIEDVIELPLGAMSTSRAHFQRYPPTPAEIENAIQVVEDTLMPVRAKIPQGAELASADAAVELVARLASAGTPLPIEAMEEVFNRLADAIMGSPASMAQIPEDPGFAASLLILREFMHHMQFAAIRLLPGER
jgi:exopolyphosphatase/pppGpp-phosphohydrolase